MASNSDFVQYIADQCAGAGEIVAKKMYQGRQAISPANRLYIGFLPDLSPFWTVVATSERKNWEISWS